MCSLSTFSPLERSIFFLDHFSLSLPTHLPHINVSKKVYQGQIYSIAIVIVLHTVDPCLILVIPYASLTPTRWVLGVEVKVNPEDCQIWLSSRNNNFKVWELSSGVRGTCLLCVRTWVQALELQDLPKYNQDSSALLSYAAWFNPLTWMWYHCHRILRPWCLSPQMNRFTQEI